MRKLAMTMALFGAVLASGPRLAEGHGGTYRGPGDVVPPGGQGGGGGGGPSGPSGPSNPNGPTSGPRTGRGSRGPVAGPNQPGQGPVSRGGQAGDDLTQWEFWWVYNKEPYLDLKRSIHSGATVTGGDDWFIGKGERRKQDQLRPSTELVHAKVVPGLMEILESERSNDIQSGALIALARIGELVDESGHGQHGLVQLFEEYLADSSQEVRETAALALGILGAPAALEPLTALSANTPAGRVLVSKTGQADASVDERTRAFATFALGLAGARLDDPEAKERVVASAIELLLGDGRASAQRDLSVAALSTIGLVPLPTSPPPSEPVPNQPTTRAEQIDWLLGYYGDESVDPRIRAHAPTALERLLQTADLRQPFTNDADRDLPELKTRVCERLLVDLGRHSKAANELVQSAVLALGRLGDAGDDEIDLRIVTALTELPDHHADQQARRFALIALGRIGGRPGLVDTAPMAQTDSVRKTLMRSLSKGATQIRPWAALALGVLENSYVGATGRAASADVAAALRRTCGRSRNASSIGAYALALGLAGDIEAKPLLLEALAETGDPTARGYVATALGLLGDRSAIEPIQAVVEESRFRHELLRSAAIALGLLGDKEVGERLVGMLEDAASLSSQAALAKALGFIGDVRSIDPLLAKMRDGKLTARARGLAAAALGLVGERGELPWSAPLSVQLNYRAATATLVDPGGSAGILDLL